MPQNTGWTDGISWFDTVSVPFQTLEEARARNEISKEFMKDPSIQFRVKHVIYRETFYYD